MRRLWSLAFAFLVLLLTVSCRSGDSPSTTAASAASAGSIASAGSVASAGAMLVVTVGPSGTTPVPAPVLPSPTPPPTPTATPVPAPVRTGNAAPPQVTARSLVVIDERSGAVLYERNAHESLPPASVTKIVTAIVALERGRIRDTVRVDYDAYGLEDSTLMGVNPGDEVTLEDLLYGIMLPSGNEATLAIANYIAGSEEDFVAMMNAKVKELGLQDSHFANPHGLDAPKHYTSAYDIAMLARYGMMRFPDFVRLSAARSWEIHGRERDGTPKDWEIYNLNRFLSRYDGADGVKIGYTDAAGRTIVASATRNGHRIYVAALNCGDIVADTAPIFNWAFDNFTWP